MNYDIKRTTQFKKRRQAHVEAGQGHPGLEMLRTDTPLPENCRDHALSGHWAGKRECHIDPDWLLVYEKCETILLLTLVRTGTHSTLLRM